MSKVLLAEDDKEVSKTVEYWLKSEGFMVDTASNGREALEHLNAFDYDVIILDWEMPEMTGVDLLRSFRARGGVTPVLMLTGRAALEHKELGFNVGADDYLTKPFLPRELVVRIRALMRRSHTTSNIITIGSITLDALACKVKRGDEEIEMQPNELRLLELLMRNPDRVFSNDELLRKCWNSEDNASPDSVYACVRRLRRKLDVKGKPSLISTVYGVGYRLDSGSESD